MAKAQIKRVSDKNVSGYEEEISAGEEQMDNEQKEMEEYREEADDQFVTGTNELWHGDVLGRYLGCKVIETDVDMPWEEETDSRFGGVKYTTFSKLYPEKKILVDLFDTSEEPDFKEVMENEITRKRQLCAENGYKYIGALVDSSVDYSEIDRQLKESEKLIAKINQK